MKSGDLIWYNTAGSKEVALVIDVVEDGRQREEFVFVCWVGDQGGVRPIMYACPCLGSARGTGRRETGWVSGKQAMWKVIK